MVTAEIWAFCVCKAVALVGCVKGCAGLHTKYWQEECLLEFNHSRRNFFLGSFLFFFFFSSCAISGIISRRALLSLHNCGEGMNKGPLKDNTWVMISSSYLFRLAYEICLRSQLADTQTPTRRCRYKNSGYRCLFKSH